MTDDSPVRFTLLNNTLVIVKKVTNNKYDFELILPTGTRKTFLWTYGISHIFRDKKGRFDYLLLEAINKFSKIALLPPST